MGEIFGDERLDQIHRSPIYARQHAAGHWRAVTLLNRHHIYRSSRNPESANFSSTLLAGGLVEFGPSASGAPF
jgi:hypothetical protein